jgi:DNA-directed RNA polymerase specialized sigma24 family protein
VGAVRGDDSDSDFRAFVSEAEPRLRGGLVAGFGIQIGEQATADAIAYGWEHWARVHGMENPIGYLFRVGQTAGQRSLRTPGRGMSMPEPNTPPMVEPALPAAIATLSDNQRISTLLVHGAGWTLTEVAALLSVRPGTVAKHAERGLDKLRRTLGVATDA